MPATNDTMNIQIKKILFPTDFSDLSQLGLRYARAFSEQFGAQLFCVHVVDEAQQYWSALGPEAMPVAPPVTSTILFENSPMTGAYADSRARSMIAR